MTRFAPRLTYANVVATLALFLALGGGVYAASKINGNKIKKESVKGNRLKPDTVTGRQVAESSLGEVPSARSADAAKSADTARAADTAANADKLAGKGPGDFVDSSSVRRWHLDATLSNGAPPSESTLDLGSLHLAVKCRVQGGGGGGTFFEITATSSAATSGWDIGGVLTDNGQPPIAFTNGGLLGPTPTTLVGADEGVDFNRQVGTLIYNAGSETITMPYTIFVSRSQATASGFCNFVSTATRVVD